MSDKLYFEDIEVGQKWTSGSRTITESDITAFAGLTGDWNPLHVDDEFAKSTSFGQRIAHGLLGLSWVAGLGSHYPNPSTLALCSIRNWEFLRPLKIGDTVHVVTMVVEKASTGRRAGRVVWQRQLLNQRGEVTQQGTFETLVANRAVHKPLGIGRKNLTEEISDSEISN
jgi:3-hydroxybutyryl-CoA dehydratase